jgi:hypothetical protein
MSPLASESAFQVASPDTSEAPSEYSVVEGFEAFVLFEMAVAAWAGKEEQLKESGNSISLESDCN